MAFENTFSGKCNIRPDRSYARRLNTRPILISDDSRQAIKQMIEPKLASSVARQQHPQQPEKAVDVRLLGRGEPCCRRGWLWLASSPRRSSQLTSTTNLWPCERFQGETESQYQEENTLNPGLFKDDVEKTCQINRL